MKHGTYRILSIAAAMAVALAGTAGAQGKDVPKTLVKFAGETLAGIGQDTVIVAAVQAQNQKGVTLEAIKEIDKKWMATTGLDDLMRSLADNACAARLKKIQEQYKFILEAFAMDDKGAVVGETNKTSDYWQGDEPKWAESYKGGAGAVHYGALSYDSSVKANIIQISVPVTAGGKAIGAITFGISVDEWEKR